MKQKLFFIIATLIVVGVAGRLLPHLPNATPITALAIVGSLYLGRTASLVLPLAVLFATDVLIGFYAPVLMASVYLSFAVIAIASTLARKYKNVLVTGYLLLGSSVFFFLVTNAAIWWYSPWYEKSLAGLLYSYELGLPFFRNMLAGDLVYTFGLLGAFALAPVALKRCKHILRTHLTWKRTVEPFCTKRGQHPSTK